MGVALVDIEWEKYTDNNTTYGKKWENCPESFITLENQQVSNFFSRKAFFQLSTLC